MRILIFTNGFLRNDPVLLLGCQILRKIDEPPTILMVIDPTIERHPPDIAAALAETCQNVGVENAQTRVRFGHLPEEIILEVQDGGYELLIMPDKKSYPLIRLLQKPLTVRITEKVPCSVLVVKGTAVESPIRRILICDSGAGSSSLLSQFIAKMAPLLDGDEEITILHVMSQISAGPGVRGVHLRAEAETLIQDQTPEGSLLARDLQTLKQSGLKPVPKIRHGLVVDEILAEAKKGDYDLVVIGAHHHQRWQDCLLDDLARKILSQLDRPVLVVK